MASSKFSGPRGRQCADRRNLSPDPSLLSTSTRSPEKNTGELFDVRVFHVTETNKESSEVIPVDSDTARDDRQLGALSLSSAHSSHN